jgi:hypothetical protein
MKKHIPTRALLGALCLTCGFAAFPAASAHAANIAFAGFVKGTKYSGWLVAGKWSGTKLKNAVKTFTNKEGLTQK